MRTLARHTRLPRRAPATTSLFGLFTAAWRQRRHLDRLDPHLQRDLGLTDAEIARESGKPFWDIPDWWR